LWWLIRIEDISTISSAKGRKKYYGRGVISLEPSKKKNKKKLSHHEVASTPFS
jgi:hypothetical protein